MALFGSKKERKTEVARENAPANRPGAASGTGISGVLMRPRITEKASMHQAIGVYTFNVAESATKTQIAEAVRAAYKVTPRAVRIVSVPSKTKRNMRTGRTGVKTGGKKAYVYLKKGETITLS